MAGPAVDGASLDKLGMRMVREWDPFPAPLPAPFPAPSLSLASLLQRNEPKAKPNMAAIFSVPATRRTLWSALLDARGRDGKDKLIIRTRSARR